MGGNVILRKSLQRVAGQANLDGFLKRFVFAPALIDDPPDHHKGANSISARAGDQHRIIAFISRQTQKFVGLRQEKEFKEVLDAQG